MQELTRQNIVSEYGLIAVNNAMKDVQIDNLSDFVEAQAKTIQHLRAALGRIKMVVDNGGSEMRDEVREICYGQLGLTV